MRDDYDKVWQLEAAEEQSLWDEAQDEALRSAAERFNDHTEDVNDHTEDVPLTISP